MVYASHRRSVPSFDVKDALGFILTCEVRSVCVLFHSVQVSAQNVMISYSHAVRITVKISHEPPAWR